MSDILKESEVLDEKINNIDGNSGVPELIRRLNREKKITRILAVSITLDILLTMGLSFLSYKVLDNNNKLVKVSQQSTVHVCEAVNSTNAIQLKLWEYLLSIPPTAPPVQTPEQMKMAADQLVQFKQYVAKAFAPEQC